MAPSDPPPILAGKRYDAPSAFKPENLLREARRQKGLPARAVPEVCVLDPDGDIVRRLLSDGRARPHDGWACYHTELYVAEPNAAETGGAVFANPIGLIGRAVGAPFAVLVAEQLFASGCRLLVSMTSAGRIAPVRTPPYFVLIERALRDEGTSYHYLPPDDFSDAPGDVLAALDGAFDGIDIPVLRGAAWTTDAPFRETDAAIDAMRLRGILAVEMEAAALYAFARARDARVVCFAHVTSQMGQIEGDFEKGHADGATDALRVIAAAVRRLAPARTEPA